VAKLGVPKTAVGTARGNGVADRQLAALTSKTAPEMAQWDNASKEYRDRI
jgi:hypothetical protein